MIGIRAKAAVQGLTTLSPSTRMADTSVKVQPLIENELPARPRDDGLDHSDARRRGRPRARAAHERQLTQILDDHAGC